MVADSLLRDHDLSLEDDYAGGRYQAFFDGPLRPHYRVRGKGGEIYLAPRGRACRCWSSPPMPPGAIRRSPSSWHSWPPFSPARSASCSREVSGRRGVRGGRRLGRGASARPSSTTPAWSSRRCRRRCSWPWPCGTRDVRASTAPTRALAVGFAARLPALAQRAATRRSPSCSCSTPSGKACGPASPWSWPGPPWRPPRVWPPTTACFTGSSTLASSTGAVRSSPSATLPDGLPGLLLDQEFGLLVYAPVFALAAPGLVHLWRRERRCAVAVRQRSRP